jgi:hypothetical protein
MHLKIKTGTQQVRTGNVYTRAITCVWSFTIIIASCAHNSIYTALILLLCRYMLVKLQWTWYRHFQRNGGLNQILRRQTSRFHYG